MWEAELVQQSGQIVSAQKSMKKDEFEGLPNGVKCLQRARTTVDFELHVGIPEARGGCLKLWNFGVSGGVGWWTAALQEVQTSQTHWNRTVSTFFFVMREVYDKNYP